MTSENPDLVSTRRKKKDQKSPPKSANTAKPRTKILLADTIGRSLCSRQSQNTLPDKHPWNLRSPSPPKAPSSHEFSRPRYSQYLTVHDATRASSSTETLTASSQCTITSLASDITKGSDRDAPLYHHRVVSLDGNASSKDVECLASKYGLSSQMGLLDPSYNVFVNTGATGAICFKIVHRVAVIMGDPICDPAQMASILDEFKVYRRQKRLRLAFLGAGKEFAQYASRKNWTVVRFGLNRVLNPLTNEVVQETGGKRILTQSRQLLNPAKAGLILDVYTPSLQGIDYELESQLGAIYDEWRSARNNSDKPQAFVTEYDPFLMPSIMTYIYSRSKDGSINGFAALRWLGANNGYHVDPCIAVPGSQRGITDLLLFSCMAYTRQLGISYLSVGYEPSRSLSEVSGMPAYIAHLTSRLYEYTYQRLAISGKRAHFEKFKPDTEQDSPVHLVFPSNIPSLRDAVAVAHVSNISLRRLVFNSRPKPER
ncbi:hypothetical protein BDV19DRAFT_197427 [Aspergillus venezuelensis]